MKITSQTYQVNNVIIQKPAATENVRESVVATNIQNTTAVIEMRIIKQIQNLNQLDNQQRLLFLKELLNLPNEWKDLLLLEFLTPQTSVSKENQELLSRLLDLGTVKNGLNKASNETLNKLLSLMQPQAAISSSEMQKMVEVLQKFLPSNETRTQDMLKDLILMYLPYLPLKEDFKLLLFDRNQNPQEAEAEGASVIILLTTKNMGTFKIEIYLENSQPKIKIDNNSDKINRRFLSRLKDLKKKFEITDGISIVKNKNLQSSGEQFQNITSSSTKIHPKILLIAYEIIKTILEVDNKISMTAQKEIS